MFDLEGLLKFAKLKQNQFGEIIGVSDSAVTKVKQGKMNLPDDWRIKIKEKLGIDPSQFDEFNYISPDNQLREPGTSQYSNSSLIKQVPFSDFMETEYLPIEAQAGYLDCLETQTMPKLDTMLISKEFEKGDYLIIEIKGDSMNDGSPRSILDGDKLLCKELSRDHWTNKLHFNQYIFVIVSHDGIVCKQITGHNTASGEITCHSWNPLYKDYVLNLENVYKLFYVKKIVERRIKF